MNARLSHLKPGDWFERPVTFKGLLWSVALPISWLTLFYAFVLHVRLSLGRWPAFGEELSILPAQIHFTAVWGVGLALFFSLFPLPTFFIFTVPFRAARHWAVYFLCYAAAIGLAFFAMNLAPGPFLNWFYD